MVAINLNPIKELLEEKVSPMELAVQLDEIEFTYATHYLESGDENGPLLDVSNNLFALRQLRKALQQCCAK